MHEILRYSILRALRALAIALIVIPTALAAQSVLSIPMEQCVYRNGDNPAWAAPNLDESGWQPYSEWRSDPLELRLWVRCHSDLAALREVVHPAIQVTFFSSYELFLNGVSIGSAGNFRNGDLSLNFIRSYPIPGSLPPAGPANVTLRILGRSSLTNSGPLRGLIDVPLQLRVGDPLYLDALRARTVLARTASHTLTIIFYGTIGVVGFLLLGLYLFDRSRREVLLLAICCLSMAILRINEFCLAALLNYPFSICLTLLVCGNLGLTVGQIPFFFAIARRRLPIYIRVLLVALALAYVPEFFEAVVGSNLPPWLSSFNFFVIRPFDFFAHAIFSAVPFFAFMPYAQIPRRFHALAALCLAWCAADIAWFAVETTGAFAIPGIPDLFARWGATLLNIRGFTTACVVGALLLLLFREQRQVSEERALFAGEVQAARSVQQYLIPENLPRTPGLAIQSEYHPAREVGGDFFQVLPQAADESVLIVIGDVAGKGIEAGMLATLIVGAVRTAAAFTSDPARILALLNERLRGRGLVTCLALLIERDGSVALVNAGHLPPYLNGAELAMEGALPLGAVPEISFPVSRFQLAPGDSLILMTDGVAEAQNAHGELFGFAQIGDMLSKGAQGKALAEAAKAFGQQDDITVLTLTRPVGERVPELPISGREPGLDPARS